MSCLQKQMIVIAHQAVRMTANGKHLVNIANEAQKRLAQRIVGENQAMPGVAVHDMIPGTDVFDA